MVSSKGGGVLSSISFTLYIDLYDINFNCKKIVCMKFGENVKQYECIFLKETKLSWVYEIKHLGSFF